MLVFHHGDSRHCFMLKFSSYYVAGDGHFLLERCPSASGSLKCVYLSDYVLCFMSLNTDLIGNLALLFSFYPVFSGILGISCMFFRTWKDASWPTFKVKKLYFYLFIFYFWNMCTLYSCFSFWFKKLWVYI